MTFEFRITKLANGDDPERSLRFKHFQNFPIDLNTPVPSLPLPEETSDEAVLQKIEGNTLVLPLSVKVIELLPTDTYVYDENLHPIAGYYTAWRLQHFLITQWENHSITQEYEFFAGHVDDNGNPDASSPEHGYNLSKRGAVSKTQLRFTHDDPVNAMLTISFIVGNVIASGAE